LFAGVKSKGKCEALSLQECITIYAYEHTNAWKKTGTRAGVISRE
jgi:hypothetical protein